MLRRRIMPLVAPRLSIDVVMRFASDIGYWASPMTCDEGRCHIIEGLSSRVRHDSFELHSASTKVSFSNCVHESTADSKLLGVASFLQTGVILDADSFVAFQPTIPRAISLLMS